MATYVKANNTAQAWSAAANWTAGSGSPSSTSDEAQWTSVVTGSTATTLVATTVGKITLTNPTGAQVLSPGTGTLTIDPSSFAGIGIELTSTGTSSFTVNCPIALGSSQEWKVASGRTLFSSSSITGSAKNLTLSDAGAKSFSGANTGWTNSTVTASAGLTTISNVNALGDASNSVVVQGTGCISFGSTIPAQTSFSVSGSGFTGGTGYGSVIIGSAWANTKTITAQATGSVITVNASVAFAPVIATAAGVTSITFNFSGSVGVSSATQSSYVVSGGVRLQSYAVNGTTVTAGSLGLATDDLPAGTGGLLGAATNSVIVETSGSIANYGTGTATLSRNYTFIGAARAATTAQAYLVSGTSGTFQFNGDVTLSGTSSDYVWIRGPNTNTSFYKFGGRLLGSANLDIGTVTGVHSSAKAEASFLPGLDLSGWTGALSVNDIYYGVNIPNAITFDNSLAAAFDNISGGPLTVSHSSYARSVNSGMLFVGTNPLTFAGGNWTPAPGTWTVSASTLTLAFNITGAGGLTKDGAGTLALSGNNTGITTTAWSAGNLSLNSAGAIGTTGADTFTVTSTGVLDNASGGAITLSKSSGASALNANFTWGGSNDLTFGSGALSWNAARTITFVNGKSGYLKFNGNIGALVNTLTLSVGGSPVGGSRSRLWLAGTNGMLATTSAVTAGYFRVSNSSGLGNAATTMWTVSSGAALEVDGGISPTSQRNCTITGPGPNTDGALRSVSGTNNWNGAIIAPVQSLASPTRIQVDAGTFTLAAGTYTTIAPTTTGTPLSFCALGSTARLNQPRQFTSNVSDVTINNGGVGTVELSVANNHTGGTTVQGGNCRVTHPTATSTGTVQVNATATLESTVQSTFTTLRLGTNGSGARAILAFAA